jgi:hypothetical protein
VCLLQREHRRSDPVSKQINSCKKDV